MTPPRRYPRNVYPLLDYDYVQELSAKDAAWLDKFNEEYYGASFSADPLHKSVDARRAIQVTKNHRLTDIYHLCPRADGESWGGADLASALAPVESDPAADPEYREALEEFRALIPADGRRRVQKGEEFQIVQARLANVAGIAAETPTPSVGVAVNKDGRIDRLRQTRNTVWNLGVTISKHQFTGAEGAAAAEMLGWLDSMIEKLNEKLRSLGAAVEGPGRGEPPPPEAKPVETPAPAAEAK